jgi:hypothetical protein
MILIPLLDDAAVIIRNCQPWRFSHGSSPISLCLSVCWHSPAEGALSAVAAGLVDGAGCSTPGQYMDGEVSETGLF